MALVEIIDGTEDVQFGNALRASFAEIAKYQRIAVRPGLGVLDWAGFRIERQAEEIAYNSERRQVHQLQLMQNVVRSAKVIGKNSLILTEKDLYGDGLNWCFGGAIPDGNGGTHIVLSTYRLQSLDLFVHVATHELGHMFKAAKRGRSNTEMNLGSHCTNLCVMEQKLSVPEMRSQAYKLSGRVDKFCYQCQDELRAYVGR